MLGFVSGLLFFLGFNVCPEAPHLPFFKALDYFIIVGLVAYSLGVQERQTRAEKLEKAESAETGEST